MMVIIRIPKAISDLINQLLFILHELINLAVSEIALLVVWYHVTQHAPQISFIKINLTIQ